jgi:hypothetical protein
MQQNQASAGGSVIGYEEKMTTQGKRVTTCGAERTTWYAATNPTVTFYSLNQPTLILRLKYTSKSKLASSAAIGHGIGCGENKAGTSTSAL